MAGLELTGGSDRIGVHGSAPAWFAVLPLCIAEYVADAAGDALGDGVAAAHCFERVGGVVISCEHGDCEFKSTVLSPVAGGGCTVGGEPGSV